MLRFLVLSVLQIPLTAALALMPAFSCTGPMISSNVGIAAYSCVTGLAGAVSVDVIAPPLTNCCRSPVDKL